MGFQSPELSMNGYGGVVCLVVFILIFVKLFRGSNSLNIFPTVGPNSWLGSWWDGLQSLTSAQSFIKEGYEKYNPTPFKIAEPSYWTVILSTRRHLEELARASDDEFSFDEAIHDQIQTRYTLGQEVLRNPYHTAVLRAQLTRNIEVLYPEIRNEMLIAFSDVLDLSKNEWKSIPALSAIERVVCRTSNRAFVGLPLCRNPDWVDLNIRYTMDVIKGGVMVGLFPEFLRPLAVQLLTNIPRSVMRGVKLLGPIVEERQQYLNEYGKNWDGKPNDLLSWLMDEAERLEMSAVCLTTRILVVNFAAIHTSSHCLTQALFYLAANPQYIQPLREEVECIVEVDGWTKTALGKMRKVDSFLRECLRIEGLKLTTLSRKALIDFSFSDGTLIPKGTLVSVPAYSRHHDKNIYANPNAFEPFRFACMDEENGSQTYQFASATTEYLPFGLGRHACPGRFFAAVELKSMLAHVVVTYDMKLEVDSTRPSSWYIGTFISADRHAKIMLRNRVR